MEQRTNMPNMQNSQSAVNNPNPPLAKVQPREGELNKQASKEDKESMTHKVGDAIERVGEKLQDMGAKKVGQAVYKAGNKIEHSGEDKH